METILDTNGEIRLGNKIWGIMEFVSDYSACFNIETAYMIRFLQFVVKYSY